MDRNLFKNRLVELRGERSRHSVAKDLFLKDQTLEKYEKGETLPNIEKAVEIAQYYGVSTDYLLGRTDITVTCEYPGWFKEVRIKALEESIEKHKKSLADHLSCIDKLTEELNTLRWEGKENDKQENQARSV